MGQLQLCPVVGTPLVSRTTKASSYAGGDAMEMPVPLLQLSWPRSWEGAVWQMPRAPLPHRVG